MPKESRCSNVEEKWLKSSCLCLFVTENLLMVECERVLHASVFNSSKTPFVFTTTCVPLV